MQINRENKTESQKEENRINKNINQKNLLDKNPDKRKEINKKDKV